MKLDLYCWFCCSITIVESTKSQNFKFQKIKKFIKLLFLYNIIYELEH